MQPDNLVVTHPSISEFLASLAGITDLSFRSHILVVGYCLRRLGQTDFSRNELEEAFVQGSLPVPHRLDARLAQLAKGSKPPLVRTDKGRYSLSLFGLREVDRYLDSVGGLQPARASLEQLVGRLTDHAEQEFLAEAIACVQVRAKRAAVVMSWLLTVDHMERYVLTHKLGDFNLALSKRTDHKGLTIKTKDDFTRLRDEKTFIEIMRSANVITNDIRKILDEKLGFRNSCAHPANIVLPDSKVISTIEDLVDNILLRYPI